MDDIANLRKWSMHQLDVKLIFLNVLLDEEVYVIQPVGFEILGQEEKVYKSRKAFLSKPQGLATRE